MKFYLGTHMGGSWLARVDVPLFVSHRRLDGRATLPRARTGWALDSGGFTELSMFGEWRTTPAEYVAATRRYRDEIGQLDWAAPQDWMCEPFMVRKTGRTVAEHQRLTVENYVHLRGTDPTLPFVPVLQGWTLDDYLRHVDMYERAGVDLAAEHTVGVGSVCRRQATSQIAEIIGRLSADGLQLHGFGVKTSGVRAYGWMLHSADSLAWSFRGRRIKPCPHTGVSSCANCLPHALEWRRGVLAGIAPTSVQLGLFGGAA